MSSFDKSSTQKKWGSIKLERLSKEIDVQRLKQLRPIIADEPLLPSILSCHVQSSTYLTTQKLIAKG